MIYVTDKAKAKFEELLESSQYKHIRFGVLGGGCSGFSYQLALVEEVDQDWICFSNIYVDQISLMYVDETTVDYVETMMESGFTFDNPNTKTSCGCGKSFSV